MKHYRMYLLNPEGRIAFCHNVKCRDDLDALAEGEKLSSANAVEVWDADRLVARVKAGNKALAPHDRRAL